MVSELIDSPSVATVGERFWRSEIGSEESNNAGWK